MENKLQFQFDGTMEFTDTPPEIEKRIIEAMRNMTAAEKFRGIFAMHDMVKQLALADIRRRHPDADMRECRLRLASRYLPPDLMKKALGWDVDKEGY